jgi:hypothetical protein
VSRPATVRYAGYLAAAEGAAGLIVAAVYLVAALTGAGRGLVRGPSGAENFSAGTAAWFAVMGAGVGAAGVALITGRRWGRGLAVFANLLLLGVAWYIRTSDQLVWAVLVAAVAITVLGLLFSPSAIGWVARSG